MAEKEFKEGILSYTSLKGGFDCIQNEVGDLDNWEDGYIAFSNKEIRIGDCKVPFKTLKDRVEGIQGAEGYLMEAGLWRKDSNTIEELYIERDGRDFRLERWRLFTEKNEERGGFKCLWRKADLLVNKRSLFSGRGITAYEVIVPDLRLHIFLTAKKMEQFHTTQGKEHEAKDEGCKSP